MYFSWAKNAGFRMNESRSKPHLYTYIYTYNIIYRYTYIYICTKLCINYCIISYYFELYTTISPLYRHCISSISPLIWTPDFYLAWLINQWVPPGDNVHPVFISFHRDSRLWKHQAGAVCVWETGDLPDYINRLLNPYGLIYPGNYMIWIHLYSECIYILLQTKFGI